MNNQAIFLYLMNYKVCCQEKVITHEMKVFSIAPEMHIGKIYKTSF